MTACFFATFFLPQNNKTCLSIFIFFFLQKSGHNSHQQDRGLALAYINRVVNEECAKGQLYFTPGELYASGVYYISLLLPLNQMKVRMKHDLEKKNFKACFFL